jgi:hypothetical protein
VVSLVDIGGIDDRSMFKLSVHNAYLFSLQFQNNKDFFLFIRLPLHIKKTASFNIKQCCTHFRQKRSRLMTLEIQVLAWTEAQKCDEVKLVNGLPSLPS